MNENDLFKAENSNIRKTVIYKPEIEKRGMPEVGAVRRPVKENQNAPNTTPVKKDNEGNKK